MRAALAVLTSLLALGVAGCGDDTEKAAAPKATAVSTDPEKVADDLAIRCGLVRPVPGTKPAVVPDGLMPAGSYVAKASRSADAAQATVLIPLGVGPSIEQIVAASAALGLHVTFKEQEAKDGEVFFNGGDGTIKLRLFGSEQCPDAATQVELNRIYDKG